MSGKRGEAWVAVQMLLLAIYLFCPRLWPDWPGGTIFRIAGGLIAIGGAVIFLWSVIRLGKTFTPFPRPLPEGELVTTGPYRFVRHPIYAGVLLCTFGYALASENWLRLACSALLLIFFDFKARAEERWLERQYSGYAAYREKTRKLLPWVY
ncbi:Protein-S-isoprenylcysteine O-methyltransferase Ste14 [Noviherbaspirillum humi]|uniref:Protein-S-isoprenylcysteine O-methyltransferase Ste14 n=1 Tax=Noviherbaspirillum humi TaxID=1688639 RepID=A0A239G5F2_9BURK|nr:isoprenylcysteine carboxylmethyltransferase family protein [Noviherbaspirillum humi]SNS64331.1 Protein-S-isoprenylcysteine O-methyltransferase Ste14 [Noviherbaspirillum humi]